MELAVCAYRHRGFRQRCLSLGWQLHRSGRGEAHSRERLSPRRTRGLRGLQDAPANQEALGGLTCPSTSTCLASGEGGLIKSTDGGTSSVGNSISFLKPVTESLAQRVSTAMWPETL